MTGYPKTRKVALATVVALLAWPTVSTSQSAPPAAADLGFSVERLERLEQRLDQYVADGQLAGGVLRVQRRGELVYEHAFGLRDSAAGDAVRTDTIFRIASQTKAIVSVATMMLQEEGRLLITDPVHQYLPEWENTTVAVARTRDGSDNGEDGSTFEVVPAERAITIRDLLTHTAGISYGDGPAVAQWVAAGITGWYFADRDEPIRETVRRMAALPMRAQPGESYVYGFSTDVLGALIEVAADQPLDELLRERIFEPLGMTDTHFYLPPSKRNRLATVYSLTRADGLVRTADAGPGHTMVSQGFYVEGPRTSFSGGAGLLSTARDYARFQQALLNGGELGGRRILSPASVRLMTVNHVGDLFSWSRGTGFGLGFSIALDLGARGTPGNTGEYGWGGAYHSVYWNDPAEGLTVTYMTQLLPAGPLQDHAVIRAMIYGALVESGD